MNFFPSKSCQIWHSFVLFIVFEHLSQCDFHVFSKFSFVERSILIYTLLLLPELALLCVTTSQKFYLCLDLEIRTVFLLLISCARCLRAFCQFCWPTNMGFIRFCVLAISSCFVVWIGRAAVFSHFMAQRFLMIILMTLFLGLIENNGNRLLLE